MTNHHAMPMRILLMTDRRERARLLAQELAHARHAIAAHIGTNDDLGAYAREARPDALVVDCEAPTGAVLDRLARLLREQPLPVVVFTDRSGREAIRAAVRAGVAAFVVDGFQPARVLPVLEAACARFQEVESLRRSRDEAVARLAERKVVERAKGILMRRRHLPEGVAYETLRRMAMDRGKRLYEVAESIVLAEEALARG